MQTQDSVFASAPGAPSGATGSDVAQSGSLSRSGLQAIADQLLESMVARDPSMLPLAQTYAATENAVPAALSMMTSWRTFTGINSRFTILDTVNQQLFLIAGMDEGLNETLLFGRIKVEAGTISELELYQNRSRGQGGFQYAGNGPDQFPEEWSLKVAAERLPSRDVLLEAGRSIFNGEIQPPEASDDCVLIENGKVVAEHPEVAAAVGGTGVEKTGKAFTPNADGSVPIPGGIPFPRPTDGGARVDVIDEVQGIVVAMAVVHGFTEPYLATLPTESAFVPEQIHAPYAGLLTEQRASGKYTAPALKAMPATGMVTQIARIYDGKIQGMHLLVNLGAHGGRSVWASSN